MAKQNPNPPTWDKSMSDGCSGVLDWLPMVGDMTDCCEEHDRAYYYGGGEAEFQAANDRFRRCNASLGKCWLCHKAAILVSRVRGWGVDRFARSAFNWKGPGLPEAEMERRVEATKALT